MRSVNPRDVSYIFRDYARNIHRKVHKEDPNLLKLSIVCAKVSWYTQAVASAAAPSRPRIPHSPLLDMTPCELSRWYWSGIDC
jgi:hypothetical protein